MFESFVLRIKKSLDNLCEHFSPAPSYAGSYAVLSDAMKYSSLQNGVKFSKLVKCVQREEKMRCGQVPQPTHRKYKRKTWEWNFVRKLPPIKHLIFAET